MEAESYSKWIGFSCLCVKFDWNDMAFEAASLPSEAVFLLPFVAVFGILNLKLGKDLLSAGVIYKI